MIEKYKITTRLIRAFLWASGFSSISGLWLFTLSYMGWKNTELAYLKAEQPLPENLSSFSGFLQTADFSDIIGWHLEFFGFTGWHDALLFESIWVFGLCICGAFIVYFSVQELLLVFSDPQNHVGKSYRWAWQSILKAKFLNLAWFLVLVLYPFAPEVKFFTGDGIGIIIVLLSLFWAILILPLGVFNIDILDKEPDKKWLKPKW